MDKEVVNFFRKIIKIEIDGNAKTVLSDIDNITEGNDPSDVLRKDYPNRYKLLDSAIESHQVDALLELIQDGAMFGFYYFFKHLEEGENIAIGERINFELTAVNEETGQRTKLISANPDEDGVYNDFQGWILDNCSELDID